MGQVKLIPTHPINFSNRKWCTINFDEKTKEKRKENNGYLPKKKNNGYNWYYISYANKLCEINTTLIRVSIVFTEYWAIKKIVFAEDFQNDCLIKVYIIITKKTLMNIWWLIERV